MNLLAPGRDHSELGAAIARVVETEPALFHGDDDRRKTASLVVSVAFRESSLRLDAVGDGGRSICAMQILGGSRDLLTDADACVRTGLSMLRRSARIDPLNPVSWYARGPRWRAEEARRISRDRMLLASRLLKEAQR